MPVIFEGTPGRVAVIKDPAVPARVRPLVRPSPTIDISGEQSIITNVVIKQNANYQFLHTLGNDIYIYVFGDRVGSMTLHGFSFPEVCNNGGNESGLEKMLNWYKRNKLSSREEPIKVAIGRITFTAFVAGFSSDVADPKTQLVRYALSVAIIPEKDDGGGGQAGAIGAAS
jgi:hypothetical protein